MRPSQARLAFAILLSASLTCLTASATTVVPPSFEHLVDNAARIVVAEVVRVEPRIVGSGTKRVILTTVSFRTVRGVKGASNQTFTLEFLGGTVGDETMEVAGAPKWVVGDRDVLFVAARASRLSPLVRLMHGRVRVMVDAARTETVAFHTGHPISDPSAFDRREIEGTRRSIRPMSLSAFIDAIDARLGERGGR
jgi:hypothetical protein